MHETGLRALNACIHCPKPLILPSSAKSLQDAFARQQRLRDMQSYVKQVEERQGLEHRGPMIRGYTSYLEELRPGACDFAVFSVRSSAL